MGRSRQMSRTVVFKADEELAAFLASLPNTSEFIRRAVMAEVRCRCPLCRGTGTVHLGPGEHYAEVLAAERSRACDYCGRAEAIPANPVAVPDSDAARWGRFFRTGTLLCPGCEREAQG